MSLSANVAKKKKKRGEKDNRQTQAGSLALGAGWRPWLLLQMETLEDRLPSVSVGQRSTILAEQHMKGRPASPLFLRPRACLRE